MASNEGILLSHLSPSHSFITVSNGHTLPVSCRGTSRLCAPTASFKLNDVLIVPSLICNLISVHRFTKNNSCTIEFDALGISVKDIPTRRVFFAAIAPVIYILSLQQPAAAAPPMLASPPHLACGTFVLVIPLL
jgi:hypothetical protein